MSFEEVYVDYYGDTVMPRATHRMYETEENSQRSYISLVRESKPLRSWFEHRESKVAVTVLIVAALAIVGLVTNIFIHNNNHLEGEENNPYFQSRLSTSETVYTKVAVALGTNRGSYLDDIEVIDISNPKIKCQNLAKLSFGSEDGLVGDLGFHDKPTICGGKNSTCHFYDDSTWKPVWSMKINRKRFAMTKSPFHNDGSRFFALGGNFLKSSEVLTENYGWQYSVPFPVGIEWHCMVSINLTSVIVIGGYHKSYGNRSAKSFIFNSEANVWREGPSMNQSRSSHSCMTIKSNNLGHEKSIIVVGGYNEMWLKSTEILNLASMQWRSGCDLPVAINRAAIIEDHLGGVIVIGGSPDANGDLDTLYRLAHADKDAKWVEMPQKLKTSRKLHIAFLVPDDITNCTTSN